MSVKLILHPKIKVERRRWGGVRRRREIIGSTQVCTHYIVGYMTIIFFLNKSNVKKRLSNTFWKKEEKFDSWEGTWSHILFTLKFFQKEEFFRCLMFNKLWTTSPSACKHYRLLAKQSELIRLFNSQVIITNHNCCFSILMALERKLRETETVMPRFIRNVYSVTLWFFLPADLLCQVLT